MSKGTNTLNWDRIEGKRKQQRGIAIHRWGKLMNDELDAIAGKHEEFVGILQEKYVTAMEQTKRQVDEFKKIIRQLKKSNGMLLKSQKSSGKKVKLHRDGQRASEIRRSQTKVSVRTSS
jgi:uncharacterized protein YjbJ (UPF0337 family)